MLTAFMFTTNHWAIYSTPNWVQTSDNKFVPGIKNEFTLLDFKGSNTTLKVLRKHTELN